MQLASTINHNKSMVEEVTSLKKDFKQKENKYLKEFLDMKALKEKVENKLYKQDQSLQTVHMLCKPKPYYNEQNKVAIGYKNPLCLTRAKQVQPALYNVYEIIKNNHVPAIVHNTEDTLEITEIPRRKMNDKMKDPECVINKVKIAPPDYSKENYLATFTPQKQLTPEQIFWSQYLIKMKAEALKKQTTASRPIKALTVYPPNTPATLVPRVLPTKSQVKINIFTLIQLFSEFEKTCKKRITLTGLTKGERGFEQTKECYLTEVIPFFKTLKEHFEGIQKALTKEIKEMKDVFEELEAEVDQNVVDRKHDEIERKNLLIAHDNLIADCLSKEVFYVATNSELNVSRFTEMHDAHTIVEARCLELEAELSNLRDKIQNDNHNELVKRFSNLEVNHLNLQLKYQNLKESFGNNPSTPARDTPDFDSAFVIGKMKASLQGKDNVINKLKTQISHLQETRSEADRTLDFRALDFQITQLTEKVTVLQEQNELFRAENAKIKQHYKELYDSIKITRAKHIEQTTALTTENENLKAQMQTKMKSVTKDHVKPTVLAPGKYAIDVEPIPPRNRNNREVHLDYLRHLKESVETLREIVEEAKVERPLDRSIVFACRYTKHSQELLEYAIGTCPKDFNKRDKKHAPTPLIRKKKVTFEEQCDTSNSNTHIHVGQLNTQQSNVHVPPSTGVNYCTNASGSQPRRITKKIKISPAKGVNKKKVEEHPRTNKSNLKTTNRVDSSSSSKRIAHPSIHNSHNVMRKVKQVWKPKLVRQVWKPTGKVLTSVGHLWRPTGRIFTLGEPFPLTRLTAPKVVVHIVLCLTWSLNVYEMVKLTHGYISSGLVQNLVSLTPYVPPSKKDYEILFQLLFDEYFNPPPRAVSPDLVAVAAPRAVDLADSPSSTTIDQDVPLLVYVRGYELMKGRGEKAVVWNCCWGVWFVDVNDRKLVVVVEKLGASGIEEEPFVKGGMGGIIFRSRWGDIGPVSCQLDEQWFNLHKDILRDALNITPANDNNPFVAPPSSDTVIEFTKLIIYHLRTKHNIHPRTGSPLHYSHEESILNTLRFVRKDGREIFGMPIPDALLTDEIKGAPYYGDYQEHVAKYQQFLDEERGKAEKGGAT
ncbi:hypothetical protein Tco_0341704 [Tanacetum coccineum]